MTGLILYVIEIHFVMFQESDDGFVGGSRGAEAPIGDDDCRVACILSFDVGE